MSAISLAWVASIKVGNQTAKQLLQFYASHNFNKPGFQFKNETLVEQLETSLSSIQRAHKLLVDENFLIKEKRYDENGRQLSNHYYLNIPDEFVDKFFKIDGEGVTQTSLGVSHRHGEGVTLKPLYNNNINNKLNNNTETKNDSVDKPDWLPKKEWEEFKQHRKSIKKPVTNLAEKKLILKLDRLRSKGFNVTEIINESIMNGWAGVFEIKKIKQEANNKQTKRIMDYEEEKISTEEWIRRDQMAYAEKIRNEKRI